MRRWTVLLLAVVVLAAAVPMMTGCSSDYDGTHTTYVGVSYHPYGYGPGWGWGWHGGYAPPPVVIGPPPLVAVPY